MSSIVSMMSAPTRTRGDNARSPSLHRSSSGPVGARPCLLPRLLRPRRHDGHDRSSSLGARVPNRQRRLGRRVSSIVTNVAPDASGMGCHPSTLLGYSSA